jgi:hypothetical protein
MALFGLGSVVGGQEALEASFAISGLETSTKRQISEVAAVGTAAIGLGVLAGHALGESALGVIDRFVGDGGMGFVPGLAVGGSVAWHNLRDKMPSRTEAGAAVSRALAAAPYLGAAAFAAFEGIESGVLTSSTGTSLLAAEAITVGVAFGATALIKGVSRAAGNLSPKNALRIARGIALGPVGYIAYEAAPKVIDNPRPLGVVIAGLGTAAIGLGAASFSSRTTGYFKRRREARDN